MIDQLDRIDRASIDGVMVRGVVCGGQRARWYPLNEINRENGIIYGVSVPQNGIDGAGLILIESVKEIRG